MTGALTVAGAYSRPAKPVRPAHVAAPAASRPQLRFLVFGDWGAGNALQKRVAAGMARWAQKAKASKPLDFVVAVGDNFYDDGVRSVSDPQWQTKFERVYDKQRLNVPFYVVLGNHDWRGNPSAEIQYARRPGTRWRMDNYFYKKSFPAGAGQPLADFLFIDSDLWNPAYKQRALAARQLKWLETNLKNSRARWQFVVHHHPPYTDGEHGPEAELARLRGLLVPIYKKYGVDAVFSGHDHQLQRILVPGQRTMYLISGAGGGGLRRRLTHHYGPFFAEKTGGFLVIDLNQSVLSGRFLDANNRVLDSWTQKPFDVPLR